MAKSKKYIDTTPLVQTFYAYFNPETEKFFSSSNVYNASTLHYAVISEYDHRDFCASKLKLEDCILDKQVDFDGTLTYKLITPQLSNEFNFQNSLLEWVTDKPSDITEFIIDWNKGDKQWVFSVTDEGRKILDGAMYDNTLVFFIILETDFDFLVRTFYIKLHELLKAGKIVYDFESNIEDNIQNLSILTKRLFNKYGLTIND
jgi:hypothetical protein